MSVTVLVEWQIKPDEIATVKHLLQETFASTLEYKGCDRYQVYEDHDNPGKILLLTEWDSREQYANYMAWRRDTGILEKFAQTFNNPPIITYLGSILP
jgi:quinol monooxygenase YgiN